MVDGSLIMLILVRFLVSMLSLLLTVFVAIEFIGYRRENRKAERMAHRSCAQMKLPHNKRIERIHKQIDEIRRHMEEW